MYEDSRVVVLESADPAAGEEASLIIRVPRMLITSIGITLVTDATVANRETRFVVDRGAVPVIYRGRFGASSTASLTTRVIAQVNGLQYGSIAANILESSLPNHMVVEDGWRVRTETAALQAADDYGPLLIVGLQF